MEPYLSFVVAARNDNYGGNFLHRMQMFVNVLLALCDRCDLDAELVIVEWNPPASRPRLKEAILWPDYLKPGMVRIIEVPNEIHHCLANSVRMPMFEYIAKNVGVRRSRGEFVLVTNPDIIFSPDLMMLFSKRALKGDCFYRVDRYDVCKAIPQDIPVEEQLEFCRKHVFRINTLVGSFPCSRLARAWIACRHTIGRLRPNRVVRGVKRRLLKIFGYCQSSASSGIRIPKLHFNASGDFILMAKDRWFEVLGFAELETHSHIDSYMVYIAYFSGLKQVVLPYPIYHQEHDRSEQEGRPLTILWDIPEFRRMIETGRPVTVNDENWGVGQVILPETEI